MTTLLIDGDGFAFRAAMLAEIPTDWGDGLWTLHADANTAINRMDAELAHVQEVLGASTMKVALTDAAENFRRSFWPSYKAKRRKTRKPMVLPVLRQHLLDNYAAYLRPNLEGDDVIGILATHPTLVPGDKIIVSADKDFFTIPGKFWRMVDDGRETVRVTEAEADRYHMLQTLTGDTTDEYPGCPGIGPDKAAKALDTGTILVPRQHVLKSGPRKGEVETRYDEQEGFPAWDVVVSRYEAAGLTEADALVQARCARILRWTDYDYQKKEPILWTP